MSAQPTRTALITGAAGGIGRVMCQTFSEDGYRVLAIDKKEDREIVCNEFLNIDLEEMCNSEANADKAISLIRNSLGSNTLNALVNNAAVQILGGLESVSIDDWSKSLKVNLTVPLLLTRGLLHELERAKGSVVNIGSIHASLTKPKFIAYSVSKSALNGLTRSLAVDLGARVRVNAINPAATETEMLLAGFDGDREKVNLLGKLHPLGRIATSKEIAQVASFLASDRASFINGASLGVDGGIAACLHDL